MNQERNVNVWRRAGRGILLASVLAVAVIVTAAAQQAGTGAVAKSPEEAFQAIQENLAGQNHQQAARALREFTRKYAGWDNIRQARLLLGKALVLSGDVTAGRNELERIIEKAPESEEVPAAYFYVAKAQEALGDFPGAVLSYQVVRLRFGDHELAPQASLNEALLAEKILQNNKRARRIYENFIRAYPQHPRAGAVLNHLGLMAEQGAGGGQAGPIAPFMQDWQVAGPFPNPQGKAFAKTFPPETEIDPEATYEGAAETEVKWQKAPEKAKNKNGFVDLAYIQPNANVCAYAYRTIESDRARQATLYLGSDDGIVAWLNGEKVISREIERGAEPDQEQKQVELKEGTNELLLKVTQGDGPWGFYCRLDYEYAWGPAAAVDFYSEYARKFPDDPGDPAMNGQVPGAAAAMWRAAELTEKNLKDLPGAVKLYREYVELPRADAGRGYEHLARLLAGHADLGDADPMFQAALEHEQDDHLRLSYARWLKGQKKQEEAIAQYRRVVKTATDQNVLKAALNELGTEGVAAYLQDNPADYTAMHHYLAWFRGGDKQQQGRKVLDRWLGRDDVDWKTAIARQWAEWTKNPEDLRRVVAAADEEGRMGVSTEVTLQLVDADLKAKKVQEAQDLLTKSLGTWGGYPDFPDGEYAVRLAGIAQRPPLMVPNPAREKWEQKKAQEAKKKAQEAKEKAQEEQEAEKQKEEGKAQDPEKAGQQNPEKKAAADAKKDEKKTAAGEEKDAKKGAKEEEPPPEQIVSAEAKAARLQAIKTIREHNLDAGPRGAEVLANLTRELTPKECADEVEAAAHRLMDAGMFDRAATQITALAEVLDEHDMRLVEMLQAAAARGSKPWKKAWKETLVPMAGTELEHFQGVKKQTEQSRLARVKLQRFFDPKKSLAAHAEYLKQHGGAENANWVRRSRYHEMQRAGQKPNKSVLEAVAKLEKDPSVVSGVPVGMVPAGPKGYELYVDSCEAALKKAKGALRADLLLGLGRIHRRFGHYRRAMDALRKLDGTAHADQAETLLVEMMSQGFFAPNVTQADAEKIFARQMDRLLSAGEGSFGAVSGDLWRLAANPAYRMHGFEDFDALYFYSAHGEFRGFRDARSFVDAMSSAWPGDGLGPDREVENNASPAAVLSGNAVGSGDKFAVYRWALLRTPQDGTYHFWGSADDWTGIEIDGQDHHFKPNRHNYHIAVELSRGLHLCRIGFADWGGGYHMKVDWQGPGVKRQRLGQEAFSPERYPLILSRAAQNQGAWGVSRWDGYLKKYPRDRRAQMMRLETLALADPQKAAGELQQLMKKYPGNPHYRERLADCLWRMGRRGEALEHYADLAGAPARNLWKSSYNQFYRRYFLRGETPVDFAVQRQDRLREAADWERWQMVAGQEDPTARLRTLIDAAARLDVLERHAQVRQESVGRLTAAITREKNQLASAKKLANKKDAKENVRAQAQEAVRRSTARIKDLEESLAETKAKQAAAQKRAATFRGALGLEDQQPSWQLYTEYARSQLETASVDAGLVFELGRDLWHRGEKEAAEPFFRYVVARSSNDGHLRWSVDRLVELAKKGEQTTEAVQILTRMGWQKPRDGHHARWLQRACDMALQTGEVYAFARNAQVLARLHPDNNKLSSYLDRLGQVFEKAGNYVSAQQEYKRVIARVRDKARVRRARLSLAGLYQKMGRPRESLKVLSNLVDLTIPGNGNGGSRSPRRSGRAKEGEKEDTEALLLAARCYLMLETNHLALDAYDRAAAQKDFGKPVKPDRELLMDLAYSCLDKRTVGTGEAQKAQDGSLPPAIVESAEKALSLVDTTFRFYAEKMTVRQKVQATLVRADASIMMRNFPQAIEEIREAKKVAGDDAARHLAQLKMGEVHLATDNIQEALSVFGELAKLNREDVSPVALFWLGTTQLQMDKREMAVKAFRQLWERYAGSELVREAVYKIARTYAKQGAFLDAIRLYEAVGAIHSTPREKVVPGEVLTVKVWDADHFLGTGQYSIPVEVRSSSGDTEDLRLEMNKINHSLFLGTIRTELGEPAPNDGTLQIYGTDVIYVTYQDKFKGLSRTEEDAQEEVSAETLRGERRLSVIQVVEDADIKVSPTEFVERDEDEEEEFYRRKTEEELQEERRLKQLSARLERGEAVIRPGNAVYLRVKDGDLDRSAERDTVEVRVFTYAPGERKTRQERERRRRLRERLSNPQGTGISAAIPSNGDFSWKRVSAPPPADRPRLDSTQVTLTETAPHSGIFYGTVKTDVNGPTAIASDYAGEKLPALAIDGNNGAEDAWLGFIDAKPGKWIEVDLKELHDVSRIVWDRGRGADDRYMIDYTVSLRGEGTPTRIERKGNQSAHENEIKLEEPVRCRWIRLTAQKYEGDAPAISQIRIYDADDNLIVPPEVSPLARVKNDVLEFNVGDCMAAVMSDEENMEPGRSLNRTSNAMGVAYVDGHIDAVYTSREENKVRGSIIHWIRTEEQRRRGHRGIPVYGRRTRRIPVNDVLQVAIADPDLDLNADLNKVECEVFSSSGDSATLTAEEIDNTAGIFTARIQLSPNESSGESGMILWVRPGDHVKMRYRDEQNRDPGHAVYRNSFVFAADDELAHFPQKVVNVPSPQDDPDSMEPPHWEMQLQEPDQALPGIDRIEMRALSFATRDSVRFNVLLRDLNGEFTSKLPVDIMEKPQVQRPEGEAANGPRRVRPLDEWWYLHRRNRQSEAEQEAFRTPLAVSGDDVVYMSYEDETAEDADGRMFVPIAGGKFLGQLQNLGVDVSTLPEAAREEGLEVVLRDPLTALQDARKSRMEGVKMEIARKKLHYRSVLADYETSLEAIGRQIDELTGQGKPQTTAPAAEGEEGEQEEAETPEEVEGEDAPLTPAEAAEAEGDLAAGTLAASENLIRAAALRRERDKLTEAMRALKGRLDALGRYETAELEEQIKAKREAARARAEQEPEEEEQTPAKKEEAPEWYETAGWWKETGGLVPGTTLQVRVEDRDLQGESATVVASLLGNNEPEFIEFTALAVEGEEGVYEVTIPTTSATGVEEKVLPVDGTRDIVLTYRDENQTEFADKREGFLSLASDAQLAVTGPDFLEQKERHHLGEDIFLLVRDPDMDKTNARDYVWVDVISDRGDSERVAVCESQPHSGVFRGTISTRFGEAKPDDGRLCAGFGGKFQVRYQDELYLGDAALPPSPEAGGFFVEGSDGTVEVFARQLRRGSLQRDVLFNTAKAKYELGKSSTEMGAIQRGQRHLKDSRDKFRLLVEHYPDDSVAAHATYYLGNIHFLLGDYPSAVESLQRVIDRWPDSEFKAKALFKLGTSHLKAARREKAIDSFVNLAYHHPDSPLVADAMLTLAQYFSKKKFYHQAIGIGQAFTRKFPAHQKTGSMFLRLAGWLIMEKQLTRAVEVLEEAEKTLPDSSHMPAYLYWHADCLFKTHGSRSDEYKKGIILLKRITYDYPDSKWAKYASARLAEVDTEG